MTLPRVLHQVWVPGADRAPLPMPLAGLAQRWRDLHPAWAHMLWTDDELQWLANRDLYDRAGELVPNHSIGQLRCDLVRWEVLWHCGGLYADVDFEPLAPFDELMNRPWVTESAARTTVHGRTLVANGLIALPPHHPLAARMIEACREACERADGTRQASRVTGPWLLSDECTDDITVLPADWFYPYSYDALDAEFVTDGCYAVHHWWHARVRHDRRELPCS